MESVDYMKIFQAIGDELSYKDILQLDGAYSVAHINYGKAPLFNNVDGRNIAKNSRKNSLSSMGHIDDVLGSLDAFNGTEQGYKKADRIELWKFYWLEYINAFDQLTHVLPKSVVTVYIGRQAIELGFKYLLVQKNVVEKEIGTLSQYVPQLHFNKIELADLLWSKYSINEEYMKYVTSFCDSYCRMIEGNNPEYFRYPEYNKSAYFAGNQLDIKWLSSNFALIILKLLHLAGLDDSYE